MIQSETISQYYFWLQKLPYQASSRTSSAYNLMKQSKNRVGSEAGDL